MEEFPANSKRAKEDPPERKITPVVTGPVTRRKPPASKRLASLIVGGDVRSVWQYVFLDVLVPAAKDMIVDATTQGFERMIFGESARTRRLSGRTPGVNTGLINYSRFAPSGLTPARRDEPRLPSPRRSGPEFDFDQIILATKVEAEEVIDRLFDIISQYEQASVRDLYELLGISSEYTYDKWGWTDIRGISYRAIRGGYLLDLPRPVVLNAP